MKRTICSISCVVSASHDFLDTANASLLGMFKSALPAFGALREFEWIGYPEFRADMVQAVLQAHPYLHTLGLIGWHFDAVGVVCEDACRLALYRTLTVLF